MNTVEIGARVRTIGTAMLRYGVVVMLLMIGSSKWTPTEAEAIGPWVTNSPFLSWIYRIASVQAGSEIIGIIEILAAVLIALRRWVPKATVIGSVMASGTFVVTLSFLATTPNQSP
jgi:reactive chlorine resistance protein C